MATPTPIDDDNRGYRVRFRFRVGMPLNVDTHEHLFEAGGRLVRLTSPNPEGRISDGCWLTANAYGFGSKDDARRFASDLRTSWLVSAVANRLGIDAGWDKPTSALFSGIKKNILDEYGILIRDNVHGVDVFPDDQNIRFFSGEARGSVCKEPDVLLSDVATFMGRTNELSDSARGGIVLLNAALMHQEPLARAILSISAVEMLGQGSRWSERQAELIGRLAAIAKVDTSLPQPEAEQISYAIARIHKISLRQGVFNLLDSLAMTQYRGLWDQMYSERSKIVHGNNRDPRSVGSQFATDAVNLCGRVVMAYIAQEIPGADYRSNIQYMAPPN